MSSHVLQASPSVAAAALSLWAAISLRYMVTGSSPQSDGYAPEGVSRILLLVPDTYRESVDLCIVLIYIWVLSTATLYQRRSKDSYQRLVAVMSFYGTMAACLILLPRFTGQDYSHWAIGLLPIVFALSLSASAVVHAGVQQRAGGTEDDGEKREASHIMKGDVQDADQEAALASSSIKG